MNQSGKRKSIWWGYFPVYLVTLLGMLITLYAFQEVTGWEHQRVETVFRDASGNRILVVKREIKHTLGTVQDIASFFDASKEVTRREFRKFVEPAIKRRGRIKALGWIPRVAAEDRAEFIIRARKSFPPFQIKEKGLQGEDAPPEERAEYYPILYVQPYKKNKQLLGLDIAADPMLLSLLLRSAETGKMQVSPRIPLTDEGVERSGFVVSVPVYYKDEPESETDLGQAGGAEPAQIRGFAFGIFRTGDIVEQALESLGAGGIDMRFYEDSPAQGQVSLYTHTSRMKAKFPLIDEEAGPEERLEYRQSIPVGEQRWVVVCTPITGRYDPDPWSGWIVLAGGIPFTVLLTIYVGTLVGRARKVNQLVEQRTEQLQEAVQALNREITERKRAEAKLKILNDDLEYWVTIRTAEAERRAQDLEQFAYVASHDLKAPLRAIGNLADWIGEDLAGKLNTESQEQLMLLKDRVRRMNALIEGLLEYSRVGRTEGSIIEVDTRELLEELIDSLSPGKGFIIDIDEEMPVFRTDRLLLGQVFSNLISNSLKHHKGDCGHIQIGVHDKPAFFEFHVSDDGVGIAPEHHEKVFMIFQILEAKDYGSNTGIGLALVKKIVREQGGVITLKSEPGHGAHFYFTWPKEPPSVAA